MLVSKTRSRMGTRSIAVKPVAEYGLEARSRFVESGCLKAGKGSDASACLGPLSTGLLGAAKLYERL